MNTRHPGNFQVRIPSFLAPHPEKWAMDLKWFTTARNDGTREPRPASGRVFAAAIARLDAMPRKERLAFLNEGFRLIQEKEAALGIPGRHRMRPYQGIVRPY